MFVPIVKLKEKKDRAGIALAPVRLVKLPVNVAGPNVAFAGRNKVTFLRSVALPAASLSVSGILGSHNQLLNEYI